MTDAREVIAKITIHADLILAALKAAGLAVVPENGDRWCWAEGDPESTYSDVQDWVHHAGPFTDEPFVQRFDWGMHVGSSWLVVRDTEEELITKEFDSADEAEAYRAMPAAEDPNP